jgi:hypothetical protein
MVASHAAKPPPIVNLEGRAPSRPSIMRQFDPTPGHDRAWPSNTFPGHDRACPSTMGKTTVNPQSAWHTVFVSPALFSYQELRR